MSASTHSSATESATWRAAVRLALALVLAMTAGRGYAMDAPPLPPRVMELVPGLQVQGGGEFTFFGISVYDGYYWSPGRGWSKDAPFALDLHYHLALEGAKIAERSVGEITKLRLGTAEQRARWGREMKRVFPDVRRGDRITGVNLPGGVVRYFYNGNSIGDIADPGFAHAFFGIWLDPKSSQIDFRQTLLGEKR
jgi:hypothetical protein